LSPIQILAVIDSQPLLPLIVSQFGCLELFSTNSFKLHQETMQKTQSFPSTHRYFLTRLESNSRSDFCEIMSWWDLGKWSGLKCPLCHEYNCFSNHRRNQGRGSITIGLPHSGNKCLGSHVDKARRSLKKFFDVS